MKKKKPKKPKKSKLKEYAQIERMRQYIWCYIGGVDIYPLGHTKSYEYAMSLSEKDYPEKYKLYELSDVHS